MDSCKSEDRLKSLYPFVNERETPLPRSWSPIDRFTFIGLSEDHLRVHYKGTGRNHHKDAASVRATNPIPAACGIYYFEVKIISKGRDGYMGVGLSASGVDMNRLPGWDKQSYGYHGDDGHSFCSSGTGTPYGPTFTTGDVIGCGVNMVENTCFYTKNGQNLGIAFSAVPANLYPTVGLQTPGEIVDANFGQQPFMFDIESMMDDLRKRTRVSIEQLPVEDDLGEFQTLLHRLTLSYLVHHGFSESAQAFAKSANQTISEPAESVRVRQKIRELIDTGRVKEAIELTEEHHPSLFKERKELHFKLKCRQFIEMIIQSWNNSKTRKKDNVKESNSDSESGTSTDLDELENMEVEDQVPGDALGDPDFLQKIIEFGKELASLEGSLNPCDEKLKVLRFDAFALLAYSDPSQSSTAYLLDSSEREAVSEELNSAIVEWMGHSRKSPLDTNLAHCKQLLRLMVKNGMGAGAFADLDAVLRTA